MQFKFLISNLAKKSYQCLVGDDIPLYVESQKKLEPNYFDGQYIRFKTDTIFLEIELDNQTGLVESLAIKWAEKAQRINSSFNLNGYFQAVFPLCILPPTNSKESKALLPTFDSDVEPSITVFDDAIVIFLSSDIISPFFFFRSNNKLGAIVDTAFNIRAFVVQHIKEDEREFFLEEFEQVETEKMIDQIHTQLFAENKEFIFKKIAALKNINLLHLLAYGLEQKFIDKKFVIDCVSYLVAEKVFSDKVFIDIASLLNHEEKDLDGLIEEHKSSFKTDISALNAVWLHLVACNELASLDVLVD